MMFKRLEEYPENLQGPIKSKGDYLNYLWKRRDELAKELKELDEEISKEEQEYQNLLDSE